MTFGEAIEALKVGDRVSRAGWRGAWAWLVLVPGSADLIAEAGKPMASVLPIGSKFNYLPHIDIATVQGTLAPWVASHGDILSEDWFVVESAHTDDAGAF